MKQYRRFMEVGQPKCRFQKDGDFWSWRVIKDSYRTGHNGCIDMRQRRVKPNVTGSRNPFFAGNWRMGLVRKEVIDLDSRPPTFSGRRWVCRAAGLLSTIQECKPPLAP